MLLFLAKITLKPNQKSKGCTKVRCGRERERKKGRKRVHIETVAWSGAFQ